MPKNILVVGQTEEHAGKTSLAQALLSFFSDQNYKTCGFKPFSGYNYWYHFDMADQSLSQGKLYGKDITQLQKNSTVKIPIEIANPIHRLWNEPNHVNSLVNIPPFIMDRFSIFEQEKLQHHLLINKHLIQKIPNHYQQNLKQNNHIFHYIDSVSQMNETIQTYYNRAIESCYEQIKKEVKIIIIESYADNALFPWKNLTGFDLVLAIKPWEIQRFDPEKYVKAIQLAKPVSAWETSTKKLSNLLKPIQTFKQQPMRSTEIIPTLKEQIPKMLTD